MPSKDAQWIIDNVVNKNDYRGSIPELSKPKASPSPWVPMKKNQLNEMNLSPEELLKLQKGFSDGGS